MARTLVAVCVVWLNVALSAQGPGEPAAQPPRLHPDVQELLAPDLRDAAMARILGRGVHRGPGDYTEQVRDPRVVHVVVCPQPRGLPIFAVFLAGVGRTRPNVPSGHLVTVTADGAVLRAWRGNNVLDEGEVFADVNADGVVERVGTINCNVDDQSLVRELFVQPITEEVGVALRVAFDWRVDRFAGWNSAWRVLPSTATEPARVQIGPEDRDTGGLAKVVAEWRWHAERKAWVGPGGGPEKDWMCLPPVGWPGLEEFAAAQRARRDR